MKTIWQETVVLEKKEIRLYDRGFHPPGAAGAGSRNWKISPKNPSRRWTSSVHICRWSRNWVHRLEPKLLAKVKDIVSTIRIDKRPCPRHLPLPYVQT